jgi:hypothetical protein
MNQNKYTKRIIDDNIMDEEYGEKIEKCYMSFLNKFSTYDNTYDILLRIATVCIDTSYDIVKLSRNGNRLPTSSVRYSSLESILRNTLISYSYFIYLYEKRNSLQDYEYVIKYYIYKDISQLNRVLKKIEILVIANTSVLNKFFITIKNIKDRIQKRIKIYFNNLLNKYIDNSDLSNYITMVSDLINEMQKEQWFAPINKDCGEETMFVYNQIIKNDFIKNIHNVDPYDQM